MSHRSLPRGVVVVFIRVLLAALLATTFIRTASGETAKTPGGATIVRAIGDFSQGNLAPFVGGTFTTQHVPAGRGGIQIDQPIEIDQPQDWSGYDTFVFDAFNPAAVPVKMLLEIRDAKTTGYWTRVNLTSVIPPGDSTLRFSTHCYVGEKSRPGRMLLRDQITRVVIAPERPGVVVSQFRLERIDVAAIQFPGLHTFSFGPANAPLMDGFVRVPETMDYTQPRGYGWDHAQFWHAFNVLQPDALTQSFLTPTAGAFRIDLPNGTYHVLMNLDMPGGYWGESQVYQSRTVTANGVPVVHDVLTFDTFLARYFRNAHQEDLPGIDPFTQYVQRMFDVKAFDVTVHDGTLLLGFQGEAWANCLSYVIVYPAGSAAKGEAFVDWITQRRHQQFDDYFKQIEPPRGASPPARYTLFTRPVGVPINAYDGPAPQEIIPPTGLALTVAQDENAALTFALQPSADALGRMDLSISALTNAQGKSLDAACCTPGWIDYRITRVAADGSVYTVAPRYWHPTPAPAAAGVTRRFWIQVHVPAPASGVYTGTITLRPEHGASAVIPLTLTVLPFPLDPISDVAVGPFGSTIPLDWPFPDPKADAWRWTMFAKSLDLLHAGGCTSLTGVPALVARAANGTIQLDTAVADRQMELLSANGFHMMVGSYGSGADLGYQMYGTASGPDAPAARRAGFANMRDYLSALYGAIDRHALEKHWLPVAWNLCDEPLGDAVAPAAANALAHRQILAGLKLTTFTGATSMDGSNPSDPHAALLQALPMPSLNLHDQAAIDLIHKAGNAFAFYNSESRWTYGRYLKMLVVKDHLAFRVSWYFSALAGDPYYALDCREDDYCWFNTDERQTMVPSILYLSQIIPGLNDYRYLSTLQRLLKERPNHPAAAAGRKVFDAMINLRPGIDISPDDLTDPARAATRYANDRAAVAAAIGDLLR
jgi:hypothetical protein